MKLLSILHAPSISRPVSYFERILSSRYALLAVLSLAAILRLAYLMELRQLPLFDMLILDSATYDQWALNIASGNWIGGDRAYYQDPLYPYLLAIIYRFFGHDLLIVRLVQIGLGIATCALVAVIGNRFGGKAIGTLAALMMAIYRPAIFNEGEVEKTALGVFLITAALALVSKRHVTARFWAGFCLALATLTRGNLIIMFPLAILYLLTEKLHNDHDKDSTEADKNWLTYINSTAVRNLLAFLLGGVLVFSPVLWRNHHVSGEWILTTSQAGPNFYTGNNPTNLSGGFWPVPFVRPHPLYEEQDFRAEAEKRAGKPLTPSEVSSFWFDESIKHITSSPGFATSMLLVKTLVFWSDVELPDGWDMYFLKRYSHILRLPLLSFGWLLPFAVIGAVTTYSGNREIKLLTGYIAIYSFSIIAFFIFSRYRMHIVPVLSILAVLGLRWLWRSIQEYNLRKLLAGSLTAITIGAVTFFFVPIFADAPHDPIRSYLSLAKLYEECGDNKAALKLLKEAQTLAPARAETLYGIGRLNVKSENFQAAIDYLLQSIEVDENIADAWYLLGVSFQAINDNISAKKCYQKQLSVIPNHQPSIEKLVGLQ